jgi:hypothetical protein
MNMTMKKIFLISVIFTMTLLMSSCSPSKFYLDSDFKGNGSNASLIVPVITEIDMYQDLEYWKPEELISIRKVFHDQLKRNFNDYLKKASNFEKVLPLAYKTPPQFSSQTFQLNEKNKIEILVPKTKYDFDISGKIFVLLLQNVRIGFKLEEQDTSDPAKHFSVQKESGLEPTLKPGKIYSQLFTIDTDYSIYDNTNGTVILCGTADIKEKYTLNMDIIAKIAESLEILAEKIIEKTPFEK